MLWAFGEVSARPVVSTFGKILPGFCFSLHAFNSLYQQSISCRSELKRANKGVFSGPGLLCFPVRLLNLSAFKLLEALLPLSTHRPRVYPLPHPKPSSGECGAVFTTGSWVTGLSVSSFHWLLDVSCVSGEASEPMSKANTGSTPPIMAA